MKYNEHIQRAIDYIEENLKEDISLEDCAKVAGYSIYHFIRIFGMAVGMPPMDYLRRRRYSRIALELEGNTRPIKDIVFEYGFNSLENFIRAFQKEFGITPGCYRNSGISLHLIDQPNFVAKTCLDIQPEIIEKEPFYLCGYCFRMNKSEIHWRIPASWNKYNAEGVGNSLPYVESREKHTAIGLSMDLPDDNIFSYIIGTELGSDRKQLIEMIDTKENGKYTVIYVPKAQYAVFHTPVADAFTFVETIHKTWSYIYGEWMPVSDWTRACGYDFEVYCERSYTYTEDIYIPIIKK